MEPNNDKPTLNQLREALGDGYLASRPSFKKAAARVKRRIGVDMAREDFDKLKSDLRTLDELLHDRKVDLTKFRVAKYVVNSWGKFGDHGQVKAHLVPLENGKPLQKIRPAARKNFTSKEVRTRSSWMENLLIPDVHFGYKMVGDWSTGDVVLEPLHDENAVWLLLKVAEEYQPTVITILGDVLDLPALSKFLSEPGLKHLVQPAIDAAGEFLQNLRAACPKSRIVFIKGNHEERIDIQLKALLPEFVGICKAGSKEPVLGIPYLLGFEENAIEYVQPYGKRVYINGVLYHHGELIGKRGGDTVSKMLGHFRRSSVCGHIHRLELAFETLHEEHGEVVIFAMSCGTLARTDGTVPGPLYPNWQKGFGVIAFGGIPQLYPIINDSVSIEGRIISVLDEVIEEEEKEE